MSRKQSGPDVVQAYVQKRQAQLEHAQMLRNERLAQQGLQPSAQGATPSYAFHAPAGAQNSTCVDLPNTQIRGPSQQPPPQPLKVTHPPMPNRPRPHIVDVTEDSFSQAVKEGIVSMDQARQLWFMLSGRQPGTLTSPLAQQRNGGGTPTRGNVVPTQQSRDGPPSSYSYQPPQPQTATPKQPQPVTPIHQTPELQSNTSYLRPDPSGKKTSAPSRKEWNDDMSVDPTEPLDAAFPSRKPTQKVDKENTKEPSLTLLKQKQLERRTSKPEWNFDQPEERDIPQVGSARGEMPYGGPSPPMVNLQQPQEKQQRQTRTVAKAPPPVQQQRQATPTTYAPPLSMNEEVPIRPRMSGANTIDEIAAVPSAQNRARQMQELEQEQQDILNEEMIECGHCGRTFRQSTFERHEKVCAKVSKPRKVFDMSKQRADGVEGLKEAKRNQMALAKVEARSKPSMVQRGEQPVMAGKQALPKWKAQSAQLQEAMKASKALKHAEAHGLPPPPPVPSAVHDDRVACPYCDRRYAPDVADRHIPKCKTMIAKPKALGALGRRK